MTFTHHSEKLSHPWVQIHVSILQAFFNSLKIPSLNTYSYKMSDLICPISGLSMQGRHRQKEPRPAMPPKTMGESEHNPTIPWLQLQRLGLQQGTGCRTLNIKLPLRIFNAGLFIIFIYYLDDEQYSCKIW